MADVGIRAHQEWLGLIQPVGLVVVPSALVAAQVELDTSLKNKWLAYDSLVADRDGERVLFDWVAFAREFLEWTPDQLGGGLGGPEIPPQLSVPLVEFGDTLEPTYAVPDPYHDGQWLLLVRVEAGGTKLDRVTSDLDGGWRATPQDRFERLLRETGVPAGLLVSDETIRLVFAPKGESSGYLSFPVDAMATPHGRPMLLALYELLKGWRLSRACPETRGLRRVLEESRKYQNVVSTRLAEQVLGTLYELARGFQAADDAARGTVLQETLRQAPSEIYGGLLTTIMRLVFVLYAEERGMLPQDAAWVENYGIGSLFERLRNDKAHYPDTMDQRFGAWPRLLTLFRVLHDGATHDGMVIPAREGDLFDPDRYPFLEGRPFGTRRVLGERLAQVPRVSDGTLLRVLERLLMLDEERLSYRALDVEQIGSVYEAMMGFEVRAALGRSVAVRPKAKKPGSPSHPVVNLDALLAVPGVGRAKWLKDEADCEVTGKDAIKELKTASNLEGLLDALNKRVSPFTPQPINRGALILVPTEERRRSGSHYTPRELTEPIVVATLRPILEAFGSAPTSAELLNLRICDPAMGSGAFLVGACRYLGDLLVEAWQRTGAMPQIPPDEDPQLFARRLVAHQCLYGVDRNPYAVQLAKLSLWLVTLAKDHPFTFLDHALRPGDSLVGLTRKQIAAFHWDTGKPPTLFAPLIEQRIGEALRVREQLEALAGTDDTRAKRQLLFDADADLLLVRRIGNAIVAAFFGAETGRGRETGRQANERLVATTAGQSGQNVEIGDLAGLLQERASPTAPFHWEIEFAEVFGRTNPGFDAILMNPPFLGGRRISTTAGDDYLEWLMLAPGSNGNADLSAHFVRRSFSLLRRGGMLGTIATNSIAQGETREAGLTWILNNGGAICYARRRRAWPGVAAVIISEVILRRGSCLSMAVLDDIPVERISAFLLASDIDELPPKLPENDGLCYNGGIVLGSGFLFADGDEEATPLAAMVAIVEAEPGYRRLIKRYMGGEDLNGSPTLQSERCVIDFGERSLIEAEHFPLLMEIIRNKVKPYRDGLKRDSYRLKWWMHGERQPELYGRIARLSRVLACSQVSPQFALAFLPPDLCFSFTLCVFPLEDDADFGVLQSRCHEVWARLLGSSLKDDLRYTPTTCFATFPFPTGWRRNSILQEVAREYYNMRSRIMIERDEGLTSTYNRFHDPDERDPNILKLRELHTAMDRAVLDAYGWTDIQPGCAFVLDYEEEEEEGSRRKKPWRFRWPDKMRDEVLARLLRLNQERAGHTESSLTLL